MRIHINNLNEKKEEGTMKTLKWSLVVLVTGLGVATVLLRTRSPGPPATDANEPKETVERNEAVVDPPAPLATVPVRKPARAVPLTPGRTDAPAVEIATESANVVRVRADRVLAKVNDRVILLKDLVPLRTDEPDQAMTVEEFDSRLNRAIEMELTFQAAAAQGVDLTPEQKQQVDGIPQRHEATFQEYTKQGVTWSSLTAGQLEFEQRLTYALLLQQNLVALEAHVAPDSDPGVQARYEQARNEVLDRLKAKANISVATAEL